MFSSFRNIYFYVLGLIITALLVIVLIYYNQLQVQKSDIFKAIPSSSGAVIKINGTIPFLTSLEGNDFWNNVSDTVFKKSFQDFREALDSLSENYSFVHELLNDSSIYISINETKVSNHPGVIFFLPIMGSVSKEKIASLVIPFFRKFGKSCAEFNTEKIKSHLDTFDWVYSYSKGNLIISNQAELISESLQQQLHKKSLLSDTSFVKVNATTGKKVAGVIYVNLKRSSNVLSGIFSKLKKNEIKNTYGINSWLALDITIDRTFISFHGFSTNNQGKTLWTKLLNKEQPAESQILEVLPKSTISYKLIALSDAYNYQLALKDFTRENPKYSERINLIKEKFGFLVKEKLFEILGEVVAKVTVSLKSGNAADFCVVKTKSTINALDFVTMVQKKLTNRKVKKNGKIFLKETNIIKLPADDLPEIFFGSSFENNSYQYLCNYGDYLIFGPTEENIQTYLSQIETGQNLAVDSTYKTIATELLASKANISIYCNMTKCLEQIKPYFNSDIAAYLEKNILYTRTNASLGVQLSGNGEFLYNNIFLYGTNPVKTAVIQNWSIPADSSLASPPVLIANSSKSQNFIFFQDNKTNIYLTTLNGKLLWKKRLGEIIIGTVKGIDYFKNGKFQFVFNTERNLYTLDIFGKSLKGFPVKFKQRATNSVEVVDFDHNLNYRYYLAFENNMFACLSKEGKKVDAWKFKKTAGKVEIPVNCFSCQKKDYIVVPSAEKIVILNRKGEEAVKMKSPIPVSANHKLFIDNRQNFFRIVSTDTSGNLFFIYPDGHFETKALGKFSSTHLFEFADVNNDGQGDFIFADSGKLSVFTNDYKLFMSTRLPDVKDEMLFVKKDQKGNSCFFLYNKTEKLLYLLNKQGKISKGFPMNGNFPLNIISLSTNNFSFALIFEHDSLISCYLLE